MSAKDLKALVRRSIEESNKGKAAAIAMVDKLFASGCVLHSVSGRDYGVAEHKKYTSEIYNAFPDMNFTLDDMIVEGDKVVWRWTWTGTHKSEFMGRPPTNVKVTLWTISIARVAGGKFVEIWQRSDTLGLMQQLGLIPTPKKEK
jgi:predicted ester cyclase